MWCGIDKTLKVDMNQNFNGEVVGLADDTTTQMLKVVWKNKLSG